MCACVSQLANCVGATRGDTRWLHGGGGESLAELNEPQLAELRDVPSGPSTWHTSSLFSPRKLRITFTANSTR